MTTQHERSFRPASRSRARIGAGVLLVLAAVTTVLLVFDSVDRRSPVLQVVRDIPAGAQITQADVRVVEVGGDPSLALVAATDLDLVVGTYAKVRIVSGALMAHPMLQPSPLLAPGSSVVAVTVPSGQLPLGLRERSQVLLVLAAQGADGAPPQPVRGRVVGLPTEPDQVTGEISVSVEVQAVDAVALAGSPTVRVVLLDPGIDAAVTAA